MRKIVVIFFATMFSLVCQSQTDVIVKNDSSKFILNNFAIIDTTSMHFPDFSKGQASFEIILNNISLVPRKNANSEYFIFERNLVLTPENLYSFKVPENNSVPALNYSFEQKNYSSRFTLFYDSVYKKLSLYDNYNHKYFSNDVLYPYHNYESALLCGSINYLFLLFEKKK